MTSTLSRLTDEFRELEQQLDGLPEVVEPPKPTLELLNSSYSERAWTKYLAYFIDPAQPHGFGTDVVEQFLTIIANHPDSRFELRSYDLKEIQVDQEPHSPDGNIPDIVIRNNDEWFICLEMKVEAQEGSTQTRKYVADSHLGDKPKDDFLDGGHNYIYLAQERHPGSVADEFIDITWKAVVKEFEPLLVDNRGKYPARSIAQFADFIDTIKQVIEMAEDTYESTQVEKLKLYFEHENAIRDVEQAVESVWESVRDSWADTFLRDFTPSEWSDKWNCHHTQYGSIYRDSWRLDENLEPTQRVSIPVRLNFNHMIRNIESFKEGRLTYVLMWEENNAYRDAFIDLFNSTSWQDRMEPHFEEHDIEVKGGPKVFTKKRYDVEKRRLPESYFETLQVAFDEHAELATIITELLSEATKKAGEED